MATTTPEAEILRRIDAMIARLDAGNETIRQVVERLERELGITSRPRLQLALVCDPCECGGNPACSRCNP